MLVRELKLKPNKTNFIVQYTGDRALKFFDYIYRESDDKNRMVRKYNKYTGFIKDGAK